MRAWQIRVVKDEKQKNPKKSHRGYAFIVYEREKDMKGTAIPHLT
jgi:U1 small nuclear ribonucleoprotein 70kDa